MDSNGKERAKRMKNFTDAEKTLLVKLVGPRIVIVENRQCNSAFNKIRADCWEEIVSTYNRHQVSGERNALQLKSLFKQLKRTSRENKAANQMDELDKKVDKIMEKYSQMETANDMNENSMDVVNTTTENSVSSPAFIEVKTYEDENVFVTEMDPIISEDITCSSDDRLARIVKRRRAWRPVAGKARNVLYRKKIQLMEVMREVEMENLRGKRIENETKAIVKEREALELRIKRLQYLAVLKENGLDSS